MMTYASRIRVLVFFCAALSCSLGLQAGEKLRVVATTSHVADLVTNVGGDLVDVRGLMGPGVDPHLYKATARDVIELQQAEIVFYSGLHLEGRLADTFTKIARRGKPVYAVTEKAPLDLLLEPEEFQGHYDPHIWFDPKIWATAVDVVVEGLSDVDPDQATQYRKNGDLYKSRIASLSFWTQERLAGVPEKRRYLVTSHDAYNYFGRAFGIQVVGVQGISTATEAGLADIAKMVDFIKEREIPAIFVESSVSPATIRRISKDSGAVVGGELFSDALGVPGEIHAGSDGEEYDVGTYIGMFRYNVDTIVEALKR